MICITDIPPKKLAGHAPISVPSCRLKSWWSIVSSGAMAPVPPANKYWKTVGQSFVQYQLFLRFVTVLKFAFYYDSIIESTLKLRN